MNQNKILCKINIRKLTETALKILLSYELLRSAIPGVYVTISIKLDLGMFVC